MRFNRNRISTSYPGTMESNISLSLIIFSGLIVTSLETCWCVQLDLFRLVRLLVPVRNKAHLAGSAGCFSLLHSKQIAAVSEQDIRNCSTTFLPVSASSLQPHFSTFAKLFLRHRGEDFFLLWQYPKLSGFELLSSQLWSLSMATSPECRDSASPKHWGEMLWN